MRSLKNILLITCLLPLLAVTCKKNDDTPIEPSIEFIDIRSQRSADGKEIINTLEFTFEDGDGNIGLDPSDTVAPFIDEFHNNFFSTMYTFKDGVFDSVQYNYRIPVVNTDEQVSDKTIRGTIYIEYVSFLSSYFDTVLYHFYILDRDFNVSNLEVSDTIFIANVN